jgi:hypothetical protein
MSDCLLILLGLVAIPLLMYLNPTDDGPLLVQLLGFAALLAICVGFYALLHGIHIKG